MNYIDKMDRMAQELGKESKEIFKNAYKFDQIDVDFEFLNPERLIKLKNNLAIYEEEIKRLFLEEGILNVYKDKNVVSRVWFSYCREQEGLTFIVENLIANSIHGGGFKITEDGTIDAFGAMTKKEFELFASVVPKDDFEEDLTMEQYSKSVVSNIIIDYATMLLYIDFLVKYRKEFVSTSNRAIENPKNPKKKTKGRSKKKINLIKKITINSGEIKKYEKQHNENIYERHLESWTVSGHFRTYRNGKKVWISPYVKGDPSKVKGKTYVIK